MNTNLRHSILQGSSEASTIGATICMGLFSTFFHQLLIASLDGRECELLVESIAFIFQRKKKPQRIIQLILIETSQEGEAKGVTDTIPALADTTD